MKCIMLSAKSNYYWIVKSILFLAVIIVLLTVVSYNAQAASHQKYQEPPTILAQQTDQLKGESELPWLFAVFFISWASFFAYVLMMSRRQKELRKEIRDLKVIQREIQSESESIMSH